MITASGKLNGFALIGMPAMLATRTDDGGVAGKTIWNGGDWLTGVALKDREGPGAVRLPPT